MENNAVNYLYRLGQMWRSLDKSRKEEYFVMARKADAEHKIKYPGKKISF